MGNLVQNLTKEYVEADQDYVNYLQRFATSGEGLPLTSESASKLKEKRDKKNKLEKDLLAAWRIN